jgi:signal transduction histidine kinase
VSAATSAAQVSCVLVLMNAMTAVVTMGRLQASAGRHRMSALDAQRERDLVASLREELEARFAETLHEVRSIVLALEGGIRVFAPRSAEGTPVASSITDSLVAELERLRMLADPDHASAPAEFSLFEALQHLSALSQASSWPVTWNLDRRLTVRGRPADVAQVVHSLLTNSQKHAPGGTVQVSAHEAGQFVLVIVDDNGPGVKPANRERIFERGERPEHEDTEGHGLGLHIARRLARGLGGELWVEQRPGGGARFVLALRNALPAASDEPAHGAAV